jgi:pyruvate-formate lyase
MTKRVRKLYDYFVTEKRHHQLRKAPIDPYIIAREFASNGTSDVDRAAQRLIYVLDQETPAVLDDEQITLTRTLTAIPEIYTHEEIEQIKKTHYLHELGDVCNITVDYTMLLDVGFEKKREQLENLKQDFLNADRLQKAHYLQLQIDILDAVQRLADRYREAAVDCGNDIVAALLARVPAKPPETFLEALQMFRFIHFTMWCGRNYHNTIGRFDQYMYPYLKSDLENGRLDEQNALQLIEEFFISFNRDSDLYPGVQQGDNGQSIVLGGKNSDGSDSFNLLSELCLRASGELMLIDPKINLRVNKDTPLNYFVMGTELTKKGLGFPQYSNDDIMIPGMVRWGYSEEDAFNYSIAACWEIIIPGKAMDIPNIGALSFAEAVEKATMNDLMHCETYDQFVAAVRNNVRSQLDTICEKVKNLYIFPAPFLSLMMRDCAEQAKDISLGCIYNNYGIHGTGISTAADAMAAIREFVYKEKSIDKETLLDALDHNFTSYEGLRGKLRYDAPKMGHNDNRADNIAVMLLDTFAVMLEGRQNERKGIFRAGTGSAMYYIWHARDLEATADGRCKGENLAANFSPGLFSRCRGPISIIQSFTKPDLVKVCNGGPLTLELHDTLFRTGESVQKVAQMVKSFIELGGHQLQLNSVNRDTLLDAQKHPEKHSNLIVRVWGWSGYFVEMDKEYQDHIISRIELG